MSSDFSILDELRRLGEELSTISNSERNAIAALDRAQLEVFATQRRALAAKLNDIHRRLPDPETRVVRDLFAAIRSEAQATAMLAHTAARRLVT